MCEHQSVWRFEHFESNTMNITTHQTNAPSSWNSTQICQIVIFVLKNCLNSVFIFILFCQKRKKALFLSKSSVAITKAKQSEPIFNTREIKDVKSMLKIKKTNISYSLDFKWPKFYVNVLSYSTFGLIWRASRTCHALATRDTLYLQIV